jgi:hypothetical protein
LARGDVCHIETRTNPINYARFVVIVPREKAEGFVANRAAGSYDWEGKFSGRVFDRLVLQPIAKR